LGSPEQSPTVFDRAIHHVFPATRNPATGWCPSD
jgi:hypothetical protein